jgi:ribonuclease P protein component
MTPPEGPASGQKGRGADSQPAVFVCQKLRVRSDFLKAAQARRQAMPGFLLQARQRAAEEAGAGAVRVGFTCSKKLGNAVARNRAKRRLREIARGVVPVAGEPGWDYVLVGRPGSTATRDFAVMRADLVRALDQIHGCAP